MVKFIRNHFQTLKSDSETIIEIEATIINILAQSKIELNHANNQLSIRTHVRKNIVTCIQHKHSQHIAKHQ